MLDPKHQTELDRRLWSFNSVPVEGSDILTENAPIIMYMSITGGLVILDKEDPTFSRHFILTERDKSEHPAPEALTSAITEINAHIAGN